MCERHEQFAGVILDMDGVVCDSEAFITEAVCRMFSETHGVTLRPEDFPPFVGTGEEYALCGIAKKHGVTLTMPRDKDRTYAIYLKMIRGRLKPLPGALDFIDACHQRGLKLAIATSAERIKLDGNLREIDLPLERFDACVTGDEIQRKKPAPDIFLLAAQRLGLTPARCLVVEDALSGIKAAKSAGCRCLALTTTFDKQTVLAAGADWVAPDLAHVPNDILED
jgi:HAD superfamily hydrolase (TIGR01509 family)